MGSGSQVEGSRNYDGFSGSNVSGALSQMRGFGNLVLALKAKLKVPWKLIWGLGSQVGASGRKVRSFVSQVRRF